MITTYTGILINTSTLQRTRVCDEVVQVKQQHPDNKACPLGRSEQLCLASSDLLHTHLALAGMRNILISIMIGLQLCLP